jgi:hypothetical protein
MACDGPVHRRLRPGRQRGEHRSGVLLVQHHIAQGAGQPFEDRGAQHQLLHRRIMCLEHLGLQEIEQMTARGAQLVHQGVPEVTDCASPRWKRPAGDDRSPF